MKADYRILPADMIRQMLDAARQLTVAIDAADEVVSSVRRYSWIPLPAALREGRTRAVKSRMMDAIAVVEAALARPCTRLLEPDAATLLDATANRIVDELPEPVFNYTSRDELVKAISAVLAPLVTSDATGSDSSEKLRDLSSYPTPVVSPIAHVTTSRTIHGRRPRETAAESWSTPGRIRNTVPDPRQRRSWYFLRKGRAALIQELAD